MKTVLLSLFMLFGLIAIPQTAIAQDTKQAAKCQFTEKDAISKLKNYVEVHFAERARTQDGQAVMGLVMYHNPQSKTEDSVDAVALVIRTTESHKILTVFGVAYIGKTRSLVYKRVLVDGKVGECFSKQTLPNPKEEAAPSK